MCEPHTAMGALAMAMILVGLLLIGTVGIIVSEENIRRNRKKKGHWGDLT